MSEKPTIFESIGAIISEMEGIGKNQRNRDQGYNFRGIDDVLKVLHPLFGKHGIFFAPEVLEREYEERISKSGTVGHVAHLHVKYRVYGPAGDSVEVSTWGEGLDYSDKATNKAMTAAFKYAMFELFAISDPDDDTDHQTDDGGSASRNEDSDRPRGRVPTGPEAENIKSILEAAELDESNSFLNDLATKFNKYGKLTENQIAAGLRQAMPLIMGAGARGDDQATALGRKIQSLPAEQKTEVSQLWDEAGLPSLRGRLTKEQLAKAERIVAFVLDPTGTSAES